MFVTLLAIYLQKEIKKHVMSAALKKGVADGLLVQVKASYKLSPEGKTSMKPKKKKAAFKKKNTAPKKKAATNKKPPTSRSSYAAGPMAPEQLTIFETGEKLTPTLLHCASNK